MLGRALIVVVAAIFGSAGGLCGANAQQPALQATQPADPAAWTFNVAPYMWPPVMQTSLSYTLPSSLGGTLATEVTVPAAEYIPDLKLAAMLSAEAQYNRFSLLTDYMYMHLQAGASDIVTRSIRFFGLAPQPISRVADLGSTTTLKATIWTLVGGYTVAEGAWGNFDLIAGFRFLGMNASTNYDLNVRLTGPRGNSATFGGGGTISGNGNIWNGIGGFRGRVRLAGTGFFIPYYFDIGSGGSILTWQIASGLGYQTGWAGVSILGRYLSFEQGRRSLIKHLDMAGPLVVVISLLARSVCQFTRSLSLKGRA